MPFGDNQRYDLILDEGGCLHRLQVKTARIRNGCVVFNTASVNGFTGKKTGYHGQIDAFMAYCPENDTVYRVPVECCGASEVNLRIDPPKSRAPISTIRMASDYVMR